MNEANTCVLTCDGHYTGEVACQFDETNGGTEWAFTYSDGDQETVEECMTCWMEYCEKPTESPTEPTNPTKPTEKPTEPPKPTKTSKKPTKPTEKPTEPPKPTMKSNKS